MTLINNPAGTTTGGITGAAGDTITNEGTITDPAAAITLGATGTLINTNLIEGGTIGATVGANSSVTNNGTIIGEVTDGLDVGAGTAGSPLTVINTGSGSEIQGNLIGVLSGADSEVTNLGTINGVLGDGTQLGADSTFNNGVSGVVTGAVSGLDEGASCSVTNDGTLTGIVFGITAGASAAITNSGFSTISGATGISSGAAAIVHNSGTITGLTADGIDVGAGSTIDVSGTVAGHTALGGIGTAISFGDAASTVGNRLILEQGSHLIGAVHGSAGAVINTLELGGGSGTLVDFAENFQNFSNIVVDAGGHWTIAGASTVLPLPTFTIAPGSTLSYNGEAACFCQGTRIRTPGGEVPVEQLRVGDLVNTLSIRTTRFTAMDEDQNCGNAVDASTTGAVKWIGRRHIALAQHAIPELVRPIRIIVNAVADGVPNHDLLVSPDHALFIDRKLIPVRLLRNNTTIYEDLRCQSVTYYHIELETHSVLLAEGLGAESYLDTGNRANFENAGSSIILHPEFGGPTDQGRRETESCAPFVTDATEVKPIWLAISRRAEALGFAVPTVKTTENPALCIVAGEKRFAPVSSVAGRYIFVLPRRCGGARLVSRSTAPSTLRPWIEDRRNLGVMVRNIVVRGGDNYTTITPDDPRLMDGWWAVERDAATLWRWTDGNACLPIEVGSMVVEVTIGGTQSYPLKASATEPAMTRFATG